MGPGCIVLLGDMRKFGLPPLRFCDLCKIVRINFSCEVFCMMEWSTAVIGLHI